MKTYYRRLAGDRSAHINHDTTVKQMKEYKIRLLRGDQSAQIHNILAENCGQNVNNELTGQSGKVFK